MPEKDQTTVNLIIEGPVLRDGQPTFDLKMVSHGKSAVVDSAEADDIGTAIDEFAQHIRKWLAEE